MSALWFQKKQKFQTGLLCRGGACKSTVTKAAAWYAYILDHQPLPLCNDCRVVWEETWDQMYTKKPILDSGLPEEIKELVASLIEIITNINPEASAKELDNLVEVVQKNYARDKSSRR